MLILNSVIWIAVTLLAYRLALLIAGVTKNFSLFHPLLITSALVALLLFVFDVSFQHYQNASQLLQWMLTPATIALAVPLYIHLGRVREVGLAIFIPILLGGVVAPVTAVSILYFYHVDATLILSTLTKSITTPLAMVTAQSIGGSAALAALMVIATGIIGVTLYRPVFGLFRIRSNTSKGIALGTVSHAIGTAQAAQISEQSAAFSSLALCINGIATAIVLPLVIYFVY